MRTVQTHALIYSLLAFWSTSAIAGAPATPGQATIPWAKDLATAQETAAQQRKLVLLHFWAPNCAPCQSVERYVFPHPDVARAVSASYVPLYVNAQALPEVAKKFGVDRWPTDVIATPEGEVLSRTVSPKDAREYTALLTRVAAAKGQSPSKWGEMAQSSRQQPPTYQSSEFQTSAASKGGAFQGGEFSSSPPNYNATRPTETTSGFGQYEANSSPPDSRNVVNNNGPGKGFPAYQENPYLDVAPSLGAAPDRASGGPPNSQFIDNRSGAPPSGVVTNPEYSAGATRGDSGNSFASGGGSFGANGGGSFGGASGGGEFGSSGGSRAQEWAPNNRQAGESSSDVYAAKTPNGRGPDYRQVTSELPINDAASRTDKPLALDGFCPVTLVQSQDWKRGTPEFGAVHRGRTYLFLGHREQAEFLADPDRFSPVLSGFDPVKFSETGEFVAGKRQFGVFYGEQIFLFADKAARQQFEASPQVFAKTAHQAMLQNAVGNRMR